MARKTKTYYRTGVIDANHWSVYKFDADLDLMTQYIVSQVEDGYLCNCLAYTFACRHIKMIEKFRKEKRIGNHPPYDFDNDRYFTVAKSATSGWSK